MGLYLELEKRSRRSIMPTEQIFPINIAISRVGEGADSIYVAMIDKIEDNSATITINGQGQVVSCNNAVESIFGYTSKELIGHNVTMIMPSPHKENHPEYLKRYLKERCGAVIDHVRNVPGN